MFLEGYNCAQAVLASCGQTRGMRRELAIRVGQAFGGGIGRTGNLCGAMTGALMVVGLGRDAVDADDAVARAAAHEKAQAVMTEFARRNGSLLCRELIGCDLRTTQGQQHFKDTDALHKVCAKAVRNAAEIIEKLLSADKKTTRDQGQ